MCTFYQSFDDDNMTSYIYNTNKYIQKERGRETETSDRHTQGTTTVIRITFHAVFNLRCSQLNSFHVKVLNVISLTEQNISSLQ